MRLLVDMNLSPDWVPLFVSHGWEAKHWSQVGKGTAPDAEIMSWAREHGHVIVTQDLDFSQILFATYAAGPIKAGLAYLGVKDRLPAAGDQKSKGLLAYGGMSFGAFSVLAAYDKKDFALAKDPTVYGVELGAKFGAANVAFSVAKAKDTTGADSVSDDATLWTLQGVYDLSKRTALYAFYTAASNGTAAALGYNTPAVDKNSNQFQLGVRHRF